MSSSKVKKVLLYTLVARCYIQSNPVNMGQVKVASDK